MKKRIFVAIKIPEEIKKELFSFQEKFKELNPVESRKAGATRSIFNGVNINWTKIENFHFTILFVGLVEEQEKEKIKEILKNVSEKSSKFYLELNKLVLGPFKEKPRMIWATGPLNEKIVNLRKDIVNAFLGNKIYFEDRHEFKTHITLARARGNELWGRKLDENLDLIIPVKEIFLMESELKSEGVEYKIIEKFKLKRS